MCKYCDENNFNDICYYSNDRGYSDKYDDKFGIGVGASLGMKGNMLSVVAGANRWTKADDYYESEGLEVDGESAVRAEPAIAKINYCPFCGKKLLDKTYEQEVAKRELPLIAKHLKSLEPIKNFYACIFRIQTYKNDINKLKDCAAIFIPWFSDKYCGIGGYSSSSKSLPAYDYEFILPYQLNEWHLRDTLPYNKSLFTDIDKKDFMKDYSGYQRHSNVLIVNKFEDVEELFETIKEDNKKWKWNKEKTLNKISDFHNKVLGKITELENRKAEIEGWLNTSKKPC